MSTKRRANPERRRRRPARAADARQPVIGVDLAPAVSVRPLDPVMLDWTNDRRDLEDGYPW